jgi:mono/diheme cytochrome c family protein
LSAQEERDEFDPESLRPGLVATYRSIGASGPVLHRIDAKPAFALGDSSPHPRIPPGPFEATWSGLLHVQDPGPIVLRAILGGELTLELDGITLLRGQSSSATGSLEASQPFARPPGLYRLAIRYRSLPEVPARLQLSWEGPSFRREPVPAWRLFHPPESVTSEWVAGERIEQGRDAAGRFGCARCHQGAFPAVAAPPPGPSLADARRRLDRDWLLRWLDSPAQVRPDARMPALFATDRAAFVERWLLAEFLSGGPKPPPDNATTGDHRAGRLAFVNLGCAACHFVPDIAREEQADLDRITFDGLGDRLGADDLATFLGNPHARYPDGRMPRFPISPAMARDIAAYLLLWSGPTSGPPADPAPTDDEIRDLARRLGVSGRDRSATAQALLTEKNCAACHPGLGSTEPRDVPIRGDEPDGCLAEAVGTHPRFRLDAATRSTLVSFLGVARTETHPSPSHERQLRLARAGCVRCHQRDTDRSPPIEEVGRTLGGAYLQTIPYQRTPRLTAPHQRLTRSYLANAVREGVSGLRAEGYTYRMPAFGDTADALVQALAEADGELTSEADPPATAPVDPTLGTLHGPDLIGSRGYSCISCHVWDGKQLSQPDPGAVGPDLTRVVGRVRRDWFDRFLEDPARSYPGTPMPTIFPHGQKALLATVLDGDPIQQREALWSYFARGREAPAPQPPPPVPITAPDPGAPPIVAQAPIRLPDDTLVEAICVLTGQHDLIVYDLATFAPRAVFVGGRILRTVQGRTRRFLADGSRVDIAADSLAPLDLPGEAHSKDRILSGYDRLADGVRVRCRMTLSSGSIESEETLRIVRDDQGGRLVRELRVSGPPAVDGAKERTTAIELPASRSAPPWEGRPLESPDPERGSLERPGYRAVAYPRPKTVAGEDRIMPSALAVHPRDGRLFVASMKTGELFVAEKPAGEAPPRFENYASGLFQDAYAMLAEDDALNVLHRRNLTRVADTDGDGQADRFNRVFGLPHGVADTYDYAYGLVRNRDGEFILGYAPYANTSMPGSGGVLRQRPGHEPAEVAFGLRNPLGWCAGPEGEVFVTDNQGEWVAANKLVHIQEGRYYGFPNPDQKQHAERPVTRPVVWVPYEWGRSINGVAYDDTGGRFGPFAGQFFLAELMYGGAIVRASVERVNGQYQGACFPFWGQGLLGPVALAFDPQGPLYVGGITEPGWMAQPDRGAVFRIDYTGEIPFEMRSIHARSDGFRIAFTRPVEPSTATDPAAYRIERFRYEYTGAYGSPELDRTPVAVQRAVIAADGLSVDLTLPPLVTDRVYRIGAPGVRSASGEPLVHPTGAYTLNEVPRP